MALTSRGLFCYPWTIEETGIEESIEFFKSKLKVDSLFVSVSYHSARLFQPRSSHKVYIRHQSGTSFVPDFDMYPIELKPIVDSGHVCNDTHHRIRDACLRYEVSYNAWVVGLHGSSLGREHPECCVVNAFDDIYDYSLCPNNSSVKRYLESLIRDICINLQPQSIVLESPGFLGFVHGHHHELFLNNLGTVGEYLLSLCFCMSCMKRARTEGISVEDVRSSVISKVEYLIDHERGALLHKSFGEGELASVLIEDGSLYQYTIMRINSVTELLMSLKAVVREYNISLFVIPSVFTRPCSKSWMEGVSLARTAQTVDGLFLLSYFSDPEFVKADVEWLRMYAKDVPLYVALNVGAPDTLNEEGLKRCVCAALRSSPIGIAFYNASLLSTTRLNWIAATDGF